MHLLNSFTKVFRRCTYLHGGVHRFGTRMCTVSQAALSVHASSDKRSRRCYCNQLGAQLDAASVTASLYRCLGL